MGDILAVAVFFFPGALFVRRAEWDRAEPIEIAGIAVACSAAFWAVAFWALRVLPLSLTTFALIAVVTSLLASIALQRKTWRLAMARWRAARSQAAGQLAFLALVLLARFVFPLTRVAYSGGDMTAHTTLAEEIVLANGFPRTQEPLQPISQFGEISPGFHVISALVSLFTSVATYRATIWVLCAAIAAATLTLYALLRALTITPAAAAAGSAAALFLARNPQFFLQWGGAPSVLAATIGFLLLREILGMSERCGPAQSLRTALLAAGLLLTHVLPAISLAWLALPILVFRAVSTRASGTVVRNAAVVLALAAILALPYLLQAPKSLAPGALAWAHDWIRAEAKSAVLLQQRFALFRGGASALSWPFYVITYLGALATLVLLAGLPLSFARRRLAAAVALICVGVNLLLFAAALGELLPAWPALYPTRIGLWLSVPLAVAFAELAERRPRLAPRAWRELALLLTVLVGVEGWRLSTLRFGTAFYETAKRGAGFLAVPIHEALGGAFWVTTFCRDNATVTDEDIAAFGWIREHTRPSAVFANNAGDGGPLIPAAAHRKILEPHYYWFFDQAEMEGWRAKTPVDYVYVGSDPAPPWGRRFTAEELDRDPRVELAAALGRARVYRVREGFRSGFR